jgi:hypothetical protein
MTTGGECAETSTAQVVEHYFSHDGSRGISRAEEQDVVFWFAIHLHRLGQSRVLEATVIE